MSGNFSMDGYIDVAERIMHFKDAHPEGSLQTVDWSVVEVGNRTFIVYRAAAFRTPDDPRPGHGIAWEPFPGPTPYTKDSELMNAETAAWGRAIVALGLAANRKIASKQEVKARQAGATSPAPKSETAPPKPASEPRATEEQRKTLSQLSDELVLSPTDLADAICGAAGQPSKTFPSMDKAYEWCERALERLPARLVGDVEKRLRAMTGAEVAA
jgi:hypothetical protein